MRSKEEFVNHWKHDLAGMVLEALTLNLTGPALSLMVKTIMEKVEKRLGQYWTDCQPDGVKQEKK